VGTRGRGDPDGWPENTPLRRAWARQKLSPLRVEAIIGGLLPIKTSRPAIGSGWWRTPPGGSTSVAGSTVSNAPPKPLS